MIGVVCEFRDEQDHACFTWSQGPASFNPYQLEPQSYVEFHELVLEARRKLSNLVSDCLTCEANLPRASFELAEVGYELYRRIFDPGADAAGRAREIRGWLDNLTRTKAVDTLEVVDNRPGTIPWNVVYDRKPDEQAFLANDESTTRWKPFWAVRYDLTAGRKVNPLRRMPTLVDPHALLVIDLEILHRLPDDQQQRLRRFVDLHQLTIVSSKDELIHEAAQQRPDLIYWLSHATPATLVLRDEEISPRQLKQLLRGDDPDVPYELGGIAFLNGCCTAERHNTGCFFDAFDNVGFSGMIGTEHQIIDTFANPMGLEFLEGFLIKHESLGKVMRRLHARVPLGLLYGTYCPSQLTVSMSAQGGSSSSSVTIVQTRHDGGTALGTGVFAVPETPPLPDEPYRSLAAYGYTDRALFAGRDDDVERFAKILDQHSVRMVVLHGESGVGKSSFLRSGVIPYLEKECLGYRFIHENSDHSHESVLFVRATYDLAASLAQALRAFCDRSFTYTTPAGNLVEVDLPGLLAKMSNDAAEATRLREILVKDLGFLARFLTAVGDQLPFTPVLVIDQCEEVFTLGRTADDTRNRHLALAMLERMAQAAGNFKVILSLRTEYHGRLMDRLRRGDPQAVGIHEYLLTDFDEERLVQAILRPQSALETPFSSEVPYKKYRFSYEQGVAESLARQIMQYSVQRHDSVLPLMQVICDQLYQRVRFRSAESRRITGDDLKSIGGIQGGLRQYVERTLDRLFQHHSSDRRLFKQLFTRLYLRQPDGSLTTALVSEDDLTNRWTGRVPFRKLIAEATSSRLLRVNTLSVGGDEERRHISLGHDALAKLAAEWDAELTRAARVFRNVRKGAGLGLVATLLVIIGLIVRAHWRSEAEAVVKQIATASLDQLPRLIQVELPKHRRWADGDLRRFVLSGDADEQLRARLALLPHDSAQVGWLHERLLTCPAEEFEVIRSGLERHGDAALLDSLRNDLRNPELADAHRFHAGTALASFAPDRLPLSADDRQMERDLAFLAKQLAAVDIREQRYYPYFHRVKELLRKPLEDLSFCVAAAEPQRLGATRALSEFFAHDCVLLTRLAGQATFEQYNIVYHKLKALDKQGRGDELRELLRGMVAGQASDGIDESGRVELGSKRANAAVTFLRLGERDEALKVLAVGKDPESVTQFVHSCRKQGVTAAELIDCVERTDQLRLATTGGQRAVHDTVLFGLLLALGNFGPQELPSPRGATLVESLERWYQNDPSSAIHSATGWLLRQWGRDEDVTGMEQQARPFSSEREWFVLTVNGRQGQVEFTDYFTFVVFRRGAFMMGSPDDPPERDRESDEKAHPVELTQPFAICDREVTRRQYQHSQKASSEDGRDWLPQLSINWNEAVKYCRWLTKQIGKHEEDQCYASPDSQAVYEERNGERWPKDWELSDHHHRTGFRLPTEAEWEFASCYRRKPKKTRQNAVFLAV